MGHRSGLLRHSGVVCRYCETGGRERSWRACWSTSVDLEVGGTSADRSGHQQAVGSAGPAKIKGVPDLGLDGDVISLAERRRQRATIVAVAGFAAAAAFALLWMRDRSTVTEIEDRLSLEVKHRQDDAAALRQEFVGELADKDRALSALEARYGTLRTANLKLATVSNKAGATAKIFIDPEKNRWLVLAFELPPAADDKDYQLWFVPTDGSAPISAGLLEVGPDGVLGASPTLPPDLGTIKAAISLEPKGGSKQPTMEQIQMIGDLI